jgi:two-component system, NarL family, invasion response regulator UvrY
MRPPRPSGQPATAHPELVSELAPNPEHPLRILIVDDHGIVREGLRQLLAAKFPNAVFGEARTAREALTLLKQPWHVMLLDITMPGQSGFDVLTQIRVIQPELKVLVLTMHSEDQYALRVLKAGASGYLTKETASQEVVSAVSKVLAGGKYVSATLAENLVANLNSPSPKSPHESLSDREYQVLRMLAIGKSVKEIGYDLSLSIKTVSTYRTRVLKKLNLHTNADVIRYAIEHRLVE